MLNATVPRPSAVSRRRACTSALKLRQVSRKLGRGPAMVRVGSRASCFHNATAFSTMVATAEPCTTWISRIWLKSASNAPNSNALATMPSSSIMHSSATTRGWVSGRARSVASAKPTVCTVCSPAPTSRNASAAAACPIQAGPLASPDSTISANGMIDSPPNCSNEPNHR